MFWLAENRISLVSGLALAGACTITFVNMIVRRFFTNFVIIGGASMIILVPLLLSTAQKLGIDLVHFGLLIVVMFMIAFIPGLSTWLPTLVYG